MDREIKKHLQNAKMVIAIFVLIKIVLGMHLELGNDEVYYVLYARHLDWGYFDHPPMIAFFIYLSTFFGALETDLMIRMSSIIACAWSSYYLFKTLLKYYGSASAWLYLVLFNTSVYFTVIAGFFVMPDAPMIFFYSIAWMAFLNYRFTKELRWWWWIGLACGGAVFSKYHGLSLPLAFGAYVLFYDRKLLKEWATYTVAVASLISLGLIVLWNYLNDFASFSYHSARVGAEETGIEWDYLLREFLGELIYIGPWVVGFFVFSIFYKKRFKDQAVTFTMLMSALPLLLFIYYMATERPTLPHWSGPAWMGLILMACIQLKNWTFSWKKAVSWSLVFYGVLLLGLGYINYWAPAVGSSEEEDLGANDFTLDLYGWSQAASQIRPVLVEQAAGETFAIVTDYWFPSAHIERYINTPYLAPHVVMGWPQDIHAFKDWDNHRFVDVTHYYYISTSRMYRTPAHKLSAELEGFELVQKVPVVRGGNTVEYFYIYEVNFKKNLD